MAKKAAAKKTVSKRKDPTESAIIQGGIVFIVVSAIAILSYVMSVYDVIK